MEGASNLDDSTSCRAGGPHQPQVLQPSGSIHVPKLRSSPLLLTQGVFLTPWAANLRFRSNLERSFRGAAQQAPQAMQGSAFPKAYRSPLASTPSVALSQEHQPDTSAPPGTPHSDTTSFAPAPRHFDMLQLRRALPSLVGRAGALGTAPTRGFAAAPQQPADKPAEDDDTYELLPPGCSLREPSYGRDR